MTTHQLPSKKKYHRQTHGQNAKCWVLASSPSSPLIHSRISQAISFLIVLAQRMSDGKPVELRNQLLGAAVEFLQCSVLYFVYALDLTHQKFGIADELKRLVSMRQRILKRSDQPLILRKIVGLVSQVFAERCDFLP